MQGKTSNAGNEARFFFNIENEEKLFAILPECPQKKIFLENSALLRQLLKIIQKRVPDENDLSNYKTLALQWYNDKEKNLPWSSMTNVMHQVGKAS